ncbi:hypothetical protein QYF36_009698 [Acer negundo]|nr:hypothetical protein QYF36_009698 [Acer negundo]
MVFVVEAIVSAVLSASLQVLFDRLSPRKNLIEFFQRHEFNDILLEDPETAMLQVNAVLSDAEEKQIINPFVRQWVDELKDAAYHTADLLDEINSLALAEHKSQEESKSKLDKRIKESKSRLKKMTLKLQNLVKHKDVLVLRRAKVERMEVTGEGFPLLQKLHIWKCENLSRIPNCFPCLEELDISECSNLEPVHIRSCNHLEEFTLNFSGMLKILEIHDCKDLRIINISKDLHQHLNFLQELKISECHNIESFSGRGLPAPNLKTFPVLNCNKLKSMPEQMHTLLSSLQTLKISGCPKLVSFPNGGLPPSLQTLTIQNCVNLTPQNEWGLRNMASLSCLTIECAYANVTSFPEDGLLLRPLLLSKLVDF